MSEKKYFSLHVDMDSPRQLLRFWGEAETPERLRQIDVFFEKAMHRALVAFKSLGVKATFFCIGEDLVASGVLKTFIKRAYDEGHEVANHSYSHPIGLSKLSLEDLRSEIVKCSDVIESVTGKPPVGFRAPSYDINRDVINLLERLGYDYDSSAFWSSMTAAMKVYHKKVGKSDGGGFGTGSSRIPRHPYYPDHNDWQAQGEKRKLIELPLPRTQLLQLPFYHNFHLWAGPLYSAFATSTLESPHLIYLLHLIEFSDLTDEGVPAEIEKHPNIKTPFARKYESLKSIVERFQKKYTAIKSEEFVRACRKAA